MNDCTIQGNSAFYIRTTPLSPPAEQDTQLVQRFPASHLGEPGGGDGNVLEMGVDAFTEKTASLLAADVGINPRLLLALGSGLWHTDDDMATLTPIFGVEYPLFVHSVARLRREPLLLAVAVWDREQQTAGVHVRTQEGVRDTDYLFSADGLVLRMATHALDGHLFSLMYQEEHVTVQTVHNRSVFNSTTRYLAPAAIASVCLGSTVSGSDDPAGKDFMLDPERLALTSLLAARGSTVLAVLPVMRINDDASERATLVLREFDASSRDTLRETLHVEQHIPELQAAIASQYTGFMSHAWLGSDAAADILLGCHDQILRVRRATAEIEVVAAAEPGSSLLDLTGSMFVQLKQAYLRFHVSLSTVPSGQLSRSCLLYTSPSPRDPE